MNLGKPRGEWYACSLHKVYIVDDSQAETCPDFWKIFTPKPERNERANALRRAQLPSSEALQEYLFEPPKPQPWQLQHGDWK